MKAAARRLRFWLWWAYLVEVGATCIYAQQSRAGSGPFRERVAAFSADEAAHANRLACIMHHTGRAPGAWATRAVAAAATCLGWCLARLHQRLVMRCDHLLEVRGIAIYERVLAALPAQAAADRVDVQALLAQEQQHAAALHAWLDGAPVT